MRSMGLILAMLVAGPVMAARTINITIAGGVKEMSLSNPSTGTVNYDVKCYNKDGTETVNSTNQNLLASRSTTVAIGFSDVGLCASSANPLQTYTDKNSKKVYMCGGSVAYGSAETLCGSGQKFCTPITQFNGCSQYMGQPVWIKSDTAATKSADNCTYNPIVAGDYFYGGACGGYYVRPAGAGCSEYLTGLSFTASTAGPFGATCCEDTTAGGICKVTINSGDFLSSPSFKGGAPF